MAHFKSKALATVVALIALAAMFGSWTQHKKAPTISISTAPTKSADNRPTKIAFFGDQGLNDDSKATLQLIKDEKADVAVHLGDFDYADNPDAWIAQINSILGPNFPYIPIRGNHEMNKWPDYQKVIVARLAHTPEVTCQGDIGAEYSCRFRDVTVAMSSPGISDAPHASLLAQELSKSTTTWNVCAWHEAQHLMQLGDKTDEAGWGVYETCREAGAIIATAHEHSYSRTYLLDSFEHQHVASTSSVLALRKGASFAFVAGLGGESIRDKTQPVGAWWAQTYTKDIGGNFGVLFCTFGTSGAPDHGNCYFKDIKGNVIDRFEVVAAPTAGK